MPSLRAICNWRPVPCIRNLLEWEKIRDSSSNTSNDIFSPLFAFVRQESNSSSIASKITSETLRVVLKERFRSPEFNSRSFRRRFSNCICPRNPSSAIETRKSVRCMFVWGQLDCSETSFVCYKAPLALFSTILTERFSLTRMRLQRFLLRYHPPGMLSLASIIDCILFSHHSGVYQVWKNTLEDHWPARFGRKVSACTFANANIPRTNIEAIADEISSQEILVSGSRRTQVLHLLQSPSFLKLVVN